MSKIVANRDVIHTGPINAGRDVVIQTTGEKNEGRQDKFRPSFFVPPNPREVLLDFSFLLDDTESLTPEAKVMREILRDGVNEQKTRIVSIYGKAGAGKSCILRALGNEEVQEKFQLKEHFPGGIYFLSLGMDATESTLIEGLVEMTRICGGEQLGKELRGEDNLRIVLKKVKEWMKDKKCLLLLDDCWERNGLGRAKVRQLVQVLSDNSESVLVLTTRFKDLARLGTAIRIQERETESEEAKAILLRHANFELEETEDEEETEAFCKVLKMCGGLPLFLSVAGRGVGELAMELESEEGERKAVWVQYWEMLQALGQDQLLDTEHDEYPDLSTTLLLSLELLSKRRGKRLGSLSVSNLTFQEMHRALCVFEKQARIPISVCRRLWKVKSDEAAFQIGEWFVGAGLADIERRRLGEKRVVHLRVHDLVHMFAVECAEKEEGVAQWHGLLLDGYLPKVRGHEVARKWWIICNDDGEEGYLFENLCRHLMRSGNVKELEGLLVSGEWSKLRLKTGGLSAWKQDFRQRLKGGKKDSGSASEKGIEKGLKMVRDAIIDSWGVVHDNPGELGFQVIGRLIDCDNQVVRRYLRSIEKSERMPWLKPMQSCWERPGEGMMIGEFHLGRNPKHHFGSGVWDIVLHKKSFTAVVCAGKEVAILDLQEMRVTARCIGHTNTVGKVGISGDGRWVFSWSSDGTVRQWDIETGEEHKDKCIKLCNKDDPIRCAAFSPVNSFVATGSKSGKIEVWDLRCGERVGRTRDASECVVCIAMSPSGQLVAAGLRTGLVVLCDVQTSSPVYMELKGHVNTALHVMFSADGRFLASCAMDSTVRLWDFESKAQVGDPFAQLEDKRFAFLGVAFSEDGKQFFSAHFDGSMSVWDLRAVVLAYCSSEAGGQQHDCQVDIWDVLRGAEIRSWQAHARWVTSLAVTGDLDSRLAVSGGEDGTVRVWDLQVTPNEENKRMHHEGGVVCVAANPDGGFFVSGSRDRTLRVWGGDDGNPLGEALCGHEDDVGAVAVSPDGRRMISGSWVGTILVWDVERRVQVGTALQGHKKGINCIHIQSEW